MPLSTGCGWQLPWCAALNDILEAYNSWQGTLLGDITDWRNLADRPLYGSQGPPADLADSLNLNANLHRAATETRDLLEGLSRLGGPLRDQLARHQASLRHEVQGLLADLAPAGPAQLRPEMLLPGAGRPFRNLFRQQE